MDSGVSSGVSRGYRDESPSAMENSFVWLVGYTCIKMDSGNASLCDARGESNTFFAYGAFLALFEALGGSRQAGKP